MPLVSLDPSVGSGDLVAVAGPGHPLAIIGDGYLPLVNALLNRTLVIESTTIQARLATWLDDEIVAPLETMTGLSWSVVNSSSTLGVIRVRHDPTIAFQGYRLTQSPTTDALIEGCEWEGCLNGLYAWLEEHGCMALGMGPAFFLQPAKTDLRLTLSKLREPLMDDAAWQWQSTVSGLRWPFGNNSEPDYFRHKHAKERLQRQVRAPWKRINSTAPAGYGGHLGFQTDAAFRGIYLTELTADPYAAAQEGRTYKNNLPVAAGDKIACNGNTYYCITLGVTSPSGSGPSGTGTDITDGTAHFTYLVAGERNGLNRASFHNTHEGHGIGSSTNYSGTSGVIGLKRDYGALVIDANAGVVNPEFVNKELNIGMAFSDGADECKDDKCQNLHFNVFGIPGISGPSDKSLWACGRIKELVDLIRPGFGTFTDFGYDVQVRVPKSGWPINSGILVQLVNWAFGSGEGIPASIRIQRWADVLAESDVKWGIYDMRNLPQYNWSDNRFPTSQAWRRDREMLAAGATVFQAESSWSNGACAIHYAGTFRMIWEGPQTYEQVMSWYAPKCFGAASDIMRLTLDRWWRDEWPAPASTHYDFGLDFKNFHDAYLAVASDEPNRTRVVKWMEYLVHLHYQQIWKIMEAASPSEAEADAFGEAYLRHVWQSHLGIMIDCIWVHDVINAGAHVSAAFKTKWQVPIGDLAPGLYPAWRTSVGITDAGYSEAESVAAFEAIRATYAVPTPASYTPPDYTALIAPLMTADATNKDTGYIYGDYVSEAGGDLLFQARAATTAVMELGFVSPVGFSAARLKVTNFLTGAVVSDIVLDTPIQPTGDSITYSYNLALLPPGFYNLHFEDPAPGGMRIKNLPRSVPIVLRTPPLRTPWFDGAFNGWPAYGGSYLGHYFAVPKGVTRFHFFSGGATFIMRANDHSIVTPTHIGGQAYRIDVPAGQAQKAWRIEITGIPNGVPRLLDLPNWYAPTEEQLIWPLNWQTE